MIEPADTSSDAVLREIDGLTLRTEANFCTVLTEECGTVLVNYTRRHKTGERVATTPVVIGDRVTVRLERGTSSGGVVSRIYPRMNELSRLAPGRTGIRDVLAANLDSVLVVQSLRTPEFNANQLDRFLAICEQAEISATIILNKVDLSTAKEAESISQAYVSVGYPVIIASARTRQGVDEVRRAIDGIAALIGPSGVGKSSLLNDILPDKVLRTAEVSDVTGKGKHTTVVADLLSLGDGDYVADTPGLKSIGLVDLDRYEVAALFRELQPLVGQCRFADCLHRGEPGCRVRRACDQGHFSEERYQSYLRLLQDVIDGYRPDWETGRTSPNFDL